MLLAAVRRCSDADLHHVDAFEPRRGSLTERSTQELERGAMKRVREECPEVKWLSSYAVLGPCDYLDVFIANDIETAARVSTLIRTFGHAQTEIWTATEWDRFKEIVRTLPGAT